MQTSTRFGVSYPSPARTDPADPAIHIGNVVTGLEKAVRHDIGLASARPISSVGTPGITGRIYYSTDDGQVSYDYGTGWISLYNTNSLLIKTLNANALNPSYQSFVGSEANPRIQVRSDGQIVWGAGSIAGDTNLYRSAVDTLKTDDNFVVAGNMTVQGSIIGGAVVPTGALMQWAGSAAPSGWLLADGSVVSRATFAALFSAIGTVYGAGDGSTTFGLPNLKARIPVGYDAGNANFNALGKVGGAETVALTIAELAAHAHAVTDPTHNHTVNNPTHDHATNGVAAGGTNPNAPGVAGVLGSADTGTGIALNLDITPAGAGVSANGSGSGISIQNNGSGSAHNNLPPYVAMNYIIKT